MDLTHALLGTSVVTTGLVSGLFYGWSVSVIPGTRRIAADSYVEAMQQINRAIINPAFIVPFLGVPAVLGAAAYLQLRGGNQRRAGLLVGAAATYVVGVLGVTLARNVPLNDALDRFDLLAADGAALARRRDTYESAWNGWHQLRTAASVAAFALASAAALVGEDA